MSVREQGQREYAPKVFEGARHREIEAEDAAGLISEEPSGTTVSADQLIHGTGNGLVLESDTVLTPSGAQRMAARKPVQRSVVTKRNAAVWVGSSPESVQNEVVAEPRSGVQDAEAVHPSQTITRNTQAGPADPTGQPCTCAYTWEVAQNPETGADEIVVYETGQLATAFRGAPRWMTWCIICGGERDGEFRPDNAVRYGNRPPEPEPGPDAASIAAEVEERLMQRMNRNTGMAEVAEVVDEAAMAQRVTESVMESVSGFLASDRFMDLMADKLGSKLAPAKAHKPSKPSPQRSPRSMPRTPEEAQEKAGAGA